jgi:hypothetical protein
MVQLKKAFVGYDSNRYTNNNRYRNKDVNHEMQIDETGQAMNNLVNDNYEIAKKNNALLMKSMYSKVSKMDQSLELYGSTETPKSIFQTLNHLKRSADPLDMNSSKPSDASNFLKKSRNTSVETKQRIQTSHKSIFKTHSTTNYGAQ